MAEELQNLIDRIRKDGVKKAEEQAGKIISEAREQAGKIVEEAEKQAETLEKKGKEEAEVYMKRSVITLQQAARDVLISVGRGVENVFNKLIKEETDRVLSSEKMADIIMAVITAYIEKAHASENITVLISPQDQDILKKAFMQKFKDAVSTGVTVKSADDIVRGFKISFKNDQVYHDFTSETIAESLSILVRPELAEIISKAVNSEKQK